MQSTLEVGHVLPMLREILLEPTQAARKLTCWQKRSLNFWRAKAQSRSPIANTRLNDLGEAVSQLLHYPYGCAEQTASSLLPWIVCGTCPGFCPYCGAAQTT